MSEKEILALIREDEWMMEVLRKVKTLNLPDWWIGAGFVRSKVWDVLHTYEERTPLPDIDVIYFDLSDFTPEEATLKTIPIETHYERQLKKLLPNLNWSVTNQARMHFFHEDKPYVNSEEALSKWVETATCVGIKLDDDDSLALIAPHGIEDLTNLILRPSPGYENKIELFNERIKKKNWLTKWPRLKVVM